MKWFLVCKIDCLLAAVIAPTSLLQFYNILIDSFYLLFFLPILPVIIGKFRIFYRFTGKFKTR